MAVKETATDGTGDILLASDAAVVCHCRQVSKGTFVHLIRQGVHDLAELRRLTGADGTQCAQHSPTGRCCTPDIVRLLRHERGMLPMA